MKKRKSFIGFMMSLIIMLTLITFPNGKIQAAARTWNVKFRVMILDDSLFTGYTYGPEAMVKQFNVSSNVNNWITAPSYNEVKTTTGFDDQNCDFLGYSTDQTFGINSSINLVASEFTNINNVYVGLNNASVYYVVRRTTPKPDYIYQLGYDANGGIQAPAEETYKGKDTSHEFTVTLQQPTYAGYSFQGWSENSDAQKPSFYGNDKIILDSLKPSKTLYAVWKKNTPQNPTLDDIRDLMKAVNIKVQDKSECKDHPTMMKIFTGMLENHTSDYKWVYSDENHYIVQIKTAGYVEEFNKQMDVEQDFSKGNRDCIHKTSSNELLVPIVWSKTENRWVIDYDKIDNQSEKVTLLLDIDRYYHVNYDNGNGHKWEESIKANSKLNKTNSGERENYVFDNWYQGENVWNFETDKVNGDVSLIGKWKENTYLLDVKGLLNGKEDRHIQLKGDGSYKKGEQVHVSSNAAALNQENDDVVYAFAGWTANIDKIQNKMDEKTIYIMPEQNVRLSAAYVSKADKNNNNIPDEEEQTYQLAYVTGTNDNIIDIPESKKGLLSGTKEKISLKIPQRLGYTFKEWKDLENNKTYASGDDILINQKDITLNAQWEKTINDILSFTVTFDTCGGNKIESIIADENSLIAVPDKPVKYGSKFIGWYKDLSYIHDWKFDEDHVNSDTVLYAKWETEHGNIDKPSNSHDVSSGSTNKDMNTPVLKSTKKEANLNQKNYDYKKVKAAVSTGDSGDIVAAISIMLGSFVLLLALRKIKKEN